MAGLDGSKEVLLPLSASAQNTLTNLVRQAGNGSVLKVSPFCHVGENNDVKGWVLEMPGDSPASALPLNCTFFDGLSVVECECTEAEALQLLTRPEETRMALGQAIHEGVMSRVTEDQRATWRRCRPTENGVPPSLYSAVLGRDSQVTLCTMPDAVPLIDSEPWTPELSPEGFVGLFHHWHPVRKRLCIYVACQSYLPKACLEFADVVRDLGDSCSSWDILHSEEAQWLRNACARNRARILAMVCQSMGLKCPCMLDYCNAEQGRMMAMVCCETLHHDMVMLHPGSRSRRRSIRVLNHCAASGTTAIACAMAPWEGIWLFQQCDGGGAQQLFMPTCTAQQPQIMMQQQQQTAGGCKSAGRAKSSRTSTLMRCTFTCPQKVTADRLEVTHVWEHQKQEASFLQQHCLLLMLCEEEGEGTSSTARTQAEEEAMMLLLMQQQQHDEEHKLKAGEDEEEEIAVAYKRSIAKRLSSRVPARQKASLGVQQPAVQQQTEYLVFDEHILQSMVNKGWKRAQGYTVLMPLAYGQCKEWWKHNMLVLKQQTNHGMA